MSRRTDTMDSGQAPDQEGFLHRFSRRKQAARLGLAEEEPAAAPVIAAVEAVPETPPGDGQMPPIGSLTPRSDFSGFLSPAVSESLHRQALRRLWEVGGLDRDDGLDVYAGDYTHFRSLGALVTTEMRHRLELEARRQAEALTRSPGTAGAGQEEIPKTGAETPMASAARVAETPKSSPPEAADS